MNESRWGHLRSWWIRSALAVLVRRLVETAILGTLTAGSFGCGRGEAAVEASRVVRAIELLRAAPNAEKSEPLRALLREPCSVEALCHLIKTCSDAYGIHLRALDAQRALRHALETPGAANSASLELVGQAERDLNRARTATEQCAVEEGKIRQDYQL